MHEPTAIVPPLPLPELTGATREALEIVLDSRAAPSAAEAARIASLTGLALRQAVYRAEDALATFDDLLLRMHDAGFQLADALETVDGDVISADQGWQVVFNALLALPPEQGELCAVALVKYRRYLRRRLTMLEERRRVVEADPGEAPAAAAGAADTEVREAAVMEADAAGAQRAPVSTERLDERAREHAEPVAPTKRRAEIVRLRGGRETRLSCSGRKALEIWLGTRRFRVLLAEAPRLVAPGGEWWVLRNGTTLVGRAPECDIAVSRAYDTVSRRHLRFRVEHGTLVSVTDLSSGGTYVRASLIPRGSRAA